MTIQEMRNKKEEMGISYAEIARRSGLPLPTVQKVLTGATKSPRYDTILALERVFSTAQSISFSSDSKTALKGSPSGQEVPVCSDYGRSYNSMGVYENDPMNFLAGESQPVYRTNAERQGTYPRRPESSTTGRRYQDSYPLLPYKRQGEYTAADRDRLPEDVRTELIDGVIYDMASPKAVHQIILMELSSQLHAQIGKCGKDCMVFVAPSDVWLTNDDKNIVQPDIYVICDFSMISEDGYTKGAPPFIVEILSPSTRSKDLLLKTYKYHAAGVKEYWIVDPEKKRVTVYDFEQNPDGSENTVHPFDDIIPIGFSGGSCSIDFNIIASALAKIGK